MGSGGQRRLLVLLLAAASLLWVPGQGQPRGERGGGGCALPAGQYRAGQSLFAGAGGVPGQAFAPAGLGEPWRRASRPRRAEPVRGPCWAARRTRGRRRGGGGRPAVRQCCPPRCHALPCAPPPSFISPLPPHLHVLQPPPPPPLSWSPFFSLGGGGPLRPAASGASHSLCGSRETLRSGRNPGEGAAPAARPLPRSLGRGGGLAGGPGRRGGAPSAAPAPAGDGAAALGVPLRGREGSRQTRRMPHAVANVNRMKLC